MTDRPSDLAHLFGDGEVSARALRVDWTATPFGKPEDWSEGLSMAIGICLGSAEPCALFAGASFGAIFNDAYAEHFLSRHTERLGETVEAIVRGSRRDAVAMLKNVIDTGRSVSDASEFTALIAPHLISASTAPASTLEPVPDGSGAILGVLHRAHFPQNGTTVRVPDWHGVILHLNDALRDIDSVPEVLHIAATIMGQCLDLERAGFALVKRDQENCTIIAEWVADPQMPSLHGRHRLSDFGPLVSAQMRAGDEMFVEDVQERITRFHEAYAKQFVDLGVRAMVNVPVMRNGALEAVFFGHHHASRKWSPDEVLLARDAAERTWSAVEQVEAQKKLQDMHVRLKLALEAGGLATWEWDLETETLEWSEEHFKLLGYAPGTIAPSFDAWKDRVHPADLDGVLEALDAARHSHGIYEHSYRVVHPDGTVRWCAARGIYFYDETDTATRMVGLMEDITDDKTAEADLRDSEERFRLIVDSARDYAIFTTDAQGYIDGWPPGAEAVFGWTAEEAIGQHADIVFVPEDRSGNVPTQEMDEARRTGHAQDVRWHQHKDGYQVFIDGSVSPLWRAPGELRGYLKIGQDITQRRKDEVALRNSEERFRVLTNTIPHMVFRGHVTGEREWNSRQWLIHTGQQESEATAFGWLQAIHPEDRAVTLTAWDEARQAGEYLVEHRIKRAEDDRYRWHQTRAVPIAGSDFAEHEWVGTSSDIHDRRQNQDRQDVMLAELQHRTYNLLAVVRAIFSETMAGATSLPAFKSQFSERLAALSRVHGMLGRSDGGTATIEAVLKLELGALAPEDSHVTLSGPEVELKPSSIQVLSLAVHELCTNAIKHGALADNRGQLAVRWDTEQDAAGARSLKVVWEERFGRSIALPENDTGGFGRQLIEHALPYQLGAQSYYDLRTDGLTCTLSVPLLDISLETVT